MIRFEMVVPAYNEEKNLPLLLEAFAQALRESDIQNLDFRLKLIDNGSTDNTSSYLAEVLAQKKYPWLDVVKVEINQGYGFGIWSGLQSTSAHFIGWTHADLQCDPKNVFRALKKILESPNPEQVLVKGVRKGRDWKDRMVSRVFELFALVILGCPFYEINAQPKVFHRKLLQQMANPPKTFALDLYLLYHAKKANLEFKSIEVLFPPRIHGASKWASHFLSRYKTILGIIRYMWSLSVNEGRL